MSLADYLPLCRRLGLDPQALPYTPKWSAAPDFLERIVDYVLEAKPEVLVECGSGMTTVMLACSCAGNGRGHLYSLENGADYAANSRAAIARYGLEHQATVLHAPLVAQRAGGRDFQWYALEGLRASAIDMLVIDGPPGFIQQHSRYPALPLLFDRLADGCMVFLDDAARPDERELVAMWQRELPVMEREYIANERGCSVLQVRRS